MLKDGDFFELDGDNYVVVAEATVGDKEYCLCNVMVDKQTLGEKYVVFLNGKEEIEQVMDDALCNSLSPIFANKINTEAYGEMLNGNGEN